MSELPKYIQDGLVRHKVLLDGLTTRVAEELDRRAAEIERLRRALERIEGIHRRNFGHQTEKLADIGPIARDALNFKEARSDDRN